MIEIFTTAVTIGTIVTWGLYRMIARKETKNRNMKKYTLILLVAAMAAGCSPCRKVAGDSSYMVWVQEGIKKNYDCVDNTKQADAYIYKVAGLPLVTDSLIGKRKPYLFLDNGDVEIYVERDKAWKAKGKRNK